MDYYLGYIISLFLSIYLAVKNYIRAAKIIWNLPGPPALPLLGNGFMLKNHKEMEQLGNTAYQRYGSYFRVWFAFLPTVFIYEPKHVKLILATNKNNQKSFVYKALHNFLGEGLITSNGHKWKKNRKLIQPYFHIQILETFVETFAECANRFVNKLEAEKTVKITPFINECVLDILHNGVLGVPLDQQSPYRKGELQAIERYSKPWLLLESIFNWTSSSKQEKAQKLSLHSYTKQIVINRKKETKKSNRSCFLDMFLEIAEKNSEFTNDDIISEAITFMLAGQDSVGATLAFTLFYIAKYPEIQEKIFDEISKIDKNGKLGINDINGMKYLEQVIKESLRLSPVVPMINRVLTEDVMFDDLLLPQGTLIGLSPYITHRLPHVFPEPQKFDPNRFEESKLENMHPYAFLPFSLGPRNCIGYKFALIEIKTIIYYLLQKYELSLPKGKEEIEIAYRATLRSKGGIWITLNSRIS
ncbi:probable cytochrome P450 4aa1 [Diorhabda sublineata]|uniref:probable cytochrome P450 4aa1 n=1 Tax=Diorhabda sublineata TaxID=1163346 RepID=UPI0024E17D00|nr:probable cytochrome P450 4aa1 [Diorhabda sublineata]XP_056637470.1 probable cytochrome P450 4aa1 [Diorhabda sublineata]XP_056637471.1 probable cytochrome P450 4aa1 [Diorhabda sublineata]